MGSKSNLTPKDQKILQYVCENFSCKICNNILMQCVTLSCGHNYCSYCVDMLHAGMLNECPQCSTSIRRAQSNNSIDQKIDNLLSSCSDSIQKAYASALNSRFQKTMDRNMARRKDASRVNYDFVNPNKRGSCLDEIRNTLQLNDINPLHSVSKSLKSARNYQHHRVAGPERQVHPKPRSKPLTVGVPKPCETPRNTSEIDINKANLLFGIYEHVLSSDNEPNKKLAAGDFLRDDDVQNMDIPVLDGFSKFTKRSEEELELLIKETDDIIRLDGHIQKWTNKMKDALSGSNESAGLADKKFDKNIHIVDDELWKASNELLQKLQGLQTQRKIVAKPHHFSLRSPQIQLPRSAKVNFDVVSDDSDVEAYDHALETLHECMENAYDYSTIHSKSRDSEEEKVYDLQTPENTNKCSKQKEQLEETKEATANKSSGGRSSSRRRDILNSVEDSGQVYIKENIEFITQMRKYKEALMKIQNREVITAQEIKELVPTTTFPSDGKDASNKRGGATTPRPLSTIGGPGSRCNHSYSARPPSSTRIDHRPMTGTYDTPSTQLIHKQIVPASKQYLKRTRTNNSLFTAR